MHTTKKRQGGERKEKTRKTTERDEDEDRTDEHGRRKEEKKSRENRKNKEKIKLVGPEPLEPSLLVRFGNLSFRRLVFIDLTDARDEVDFVCPEDGGLVKELWIGKFMKRIVRYLLGENLPTESSRFDVPCSQST